MLNGIKAVIFDMDGVIIDSEPLWRQSMIKSFNEIGIPLTTGMRFKEVISFWFERYNIIHVSNQEFNDLVLNRLISSIKLEGRPLKGVLESLDYLKKNGYRLAIGTSSDIKLMNAVVENLGIKDFFDALCSAELLKYGKPHPEVFLNCAQILNVLPKECLVIEDSVNGVIAAKAAQMKVLVVPDSETMDNPKFSVADYKLTSLLDFIPN